MYNKVLHHTDISNKHIVVTGGAGFIGSNIVEYLVQHKAGKITIVDNLATGFKQNITPYLSLPQVTFLEGDIRDAALCYRACTDADLVCHQAAMGSVPRSIKDPITTNGVNVSGFVNMLKAAQEAGVARFVYASSSSVYGDEPTLPKVEDRVGSPLSPYAVSKKANELYGQVFADAYGMSIIGLRYFNIFGPRQDPKGAYAAVIPLFIDGLQQNKPVYINGDGANSRDFTYIENAVQANVKALTVPDYSGHTVLNIAVGERFTVLQLFEAIRDLMGKEATPIFRSERPGDIPHSLADITRAQQLIGYAPTVKFEEGLARTIEYFKTTY